MRDLLQRTFQQIVAVVGRNLWANVRLVSHQSPLRYVGLMERLLLPFQFQAQSSALAANLVASTLLRLSQLLSVYQST
jgi:hypothetical protein